MKPQQTETKLESENPKRKEVKYQLQSKKRRRRNVRDNEIELLRAGKIADTRVSNISGLVSRDDVVPYAHFGRVKRVFLGAIAFNFSVPSGISSVLFFSLASACSSLLSAVALPLQRGAAATRVFFLVKSNGI